MAAPLLVWAIPLTHGTGGREPWVLALGLLSLVPALVWLRPWRHVPASHLLVAGAPAFAALLVSVTAPTRWDGLNEFAAFAYAAGIYAVVRGFAWSAQRRTLLLVVVALVGLEQFTRGYLPWWGGGTVSRLMVGTFYWHNQFAAFMAATGVVALALAGRGQGAARLAGWLIAPWCVAAMFLAGSRAGLGIFLVVSIGMIGLALRDRVGRVAMVGLLLLGSALATLLSSSMLMAEGGAASATLEAREGDQSVTGNGRARLDLWVAALRLGMQRPLTGQGFDSYGGASLPVMPSEATLSTFAHNGYLQALSDGGLVLFVPVAAATLLVVAASMRSLRRRRDGAEVAAIAAPVGLIVLLLHSGVDFDWAYPSLLAMFALLAALIPPGSAGPRPSSGNRQVPAVVAGTTLLIFVALAAPAAVRASSLHATEAMPPWWARLASAGVPLSERVGWLPAVSVCRRDLTSSDPAVVQRARSCTATAATQDPTLSLARAGGLIGIGSVREGLQEAEVVTERYQSIRPMLRLNYAHLLLRAGQPAAALAELEDLRRVLVKRGMKTGAVDAALVSLR